MDSQNANEKIKAHCNNCGGLKNHIVLHTEEGTEAEDGWWAYHTYRTITCAGCDNIHLKYYYELSGLVDPAAIGIRDVMAPDYGDPVEIRPGEIPVFWACGVTPQAVIAKTRPGFCITHAPGYMLVTDIRNGTLATG